jgi:hypothetical protein
VSLLQNQDHFKKWQDGLVSFRNTTESIGDKGSKRMMKIKIAGTTISMQEEILDLDIPHYWKAEYTSKGVRNVQENYFTEEVVDGKLVTHWNSTSTFKFTGMMRLIAKAQPKTFRNQTSRFMQNFKAFAEANFQPA